ncbi:Acylphosphatase-like domain-containing protein [Kalaharituber pfeilii]|nr:Acylphosphatase-like domain-containing protein [Kalaharituber pfeilii]
MSNHSETSMQLKRYSFLVHGFVQGVWFRAYTHRAAVNHNVTGYVRNLPNGKVAGEAQGTETALAAFLKDVDKGSPGSTVIRVETEIQKIVEGEKEFVIRR